VCSSLHTVCLAVTLLQGAPVWHAEHVSRQTTVVLPTREGPRFDRPPRHLQCTIQLSWRQPFLLTLSTASRTATLSAQQQQVYNACRWGVIVLAIALLATVQVMLSPHRGQSRWPVQLTACLWYVQIGPSELVLHLQPVLGIDAARVSTTTTHSAAAKAASHWSHSQRRSCAVRQWTAAAGATTATAAATAASPQFGSLPPAGVVTGGRGRSISLVMRSTPGSLPVRVAGHHQSQHDSPQSRD
jgi:hypothetical protein